MKNKPTIEDEAKRLRGLIVSDWALQWNDISWEYQERWLRLARHVRRREKKAFRDGCRGVAEWGRKFESLAHAK